MIVVAGNARRRNFVFRIRAAMARTAIGDARDEQVAGVVRLARSVAAFAFDRGVFAVGEFRYLVAIRAGFAGEQRLGHAACLFARPGQSLLLLLLRQWW